MPIAAINPANLSYSIERFDKIQGETALKIGIIASAIFAGLALIAIPPLGIYAGVTVFQLLARSYITPNTFKKEGQIPKEIEKEDLLGAGAQKAVYATDDISQVCILGKNRVFDEPDMIQEYKFKRELQEKAAAFNGAPANVNRAVDLGYLDVEFSEIDYKGHYAIVAPRAESDLERVISKEMDVNDRLKYCNDLIKSVQALHSLSIAYGDFKPENFLFYGKESDYPVRLSDFGRAEEVREGETKVIFGNTRFAPPEGTLSLQGDVWSAAITCIRILEEQFIHKQKEVDEHGNEVVTSVRGDPLLAIDREDRDRHTNSSGYRGIEKYIIDHKAFNGMQDGGSLQKLIRRGKMILPKPEGFAERQSDLIHNYIDTLFDENHLGLHLQNEVKNQFLQTLKAMTSPLPEERPAITDVDLSLEE